MKVLALCRWINKMHNIRSYLKHSNISKSPFRFRMDSYVKNCGFEEYIKPDTLIRYIAKSNSGNHNEITLKKNKSSLGIELKPHIIEEQDISFSKISFISETRNIIPLWADRGASLIGGYLGFYFHETFSDFELSTEINQHLELGFLDVKFSVKKQGNQKKYIIQSKQGDSFEIDFRNSSSGTQTSVPILSISEHFSKSFDFEKAFNRSVLSYLSQSDNLTLNL